MFNNFVILAGMVSRVLSKIVACIVGGGGGGGGVSGKNFQMTKKFPDLSWHTEATKVFAIRKMKTQ